MLCYLEPVVRLDQLIIMFPKCRAKMDPKLGPGSKMGNKDNLDPF